jgi:hypothetical protein
VQLITARLRRWIVLAGSLIALIVSCGAEKQPPPSPLSPDELYLVDAYVRVRRASSLFEFQRAVGDSLLAGLAGEVDTLRIARTIAGLNANPERWVFILENVERELTESSANAASETTGR